MYSFTPGVVAAIINAVVATLQFVIPNALIFTLVATLSEDHTAATWSVVARTLQSSAWPLLLRSDSAASKHVQLSTEIIVLLRPVALGLVALAAIVTPLGLYEAIEPATAPHTVKFVRQPDEGPFGLLTPPRSDLGFSRHCSDDGGMLPGQCPGTNTLITHANNSMSFNATIPNDDHDRRIPAQLAELYQSGLATLPTSVSSYFDIEWRWYNTHKRDNMRNISYTVESYHSIAPVIGDGDVKLIEGLIVDTREGGVGFRNHAVPLADDVPHGAEWEEDILFLVPETACVDTNLTLENKIPTDDYYGGPTSIVDQGGFIELSRDVSWSDTTYQSTQQDPELRTRAYRAAWVMNALNMFYLNVTKPGTNMTAPFDSHVGKRFAVNNSVTESGPEDHSAALMALAMVETRFNGLIDMPYHASEDEGLSYDLYGYVNPYDIGQTNYTVTDDVCQGLFVGAWANSTNIQVKCGLVLGPANKTNGPNTPLIEPGTIWTRPIHMCASTTKATIKTVSFSFNQTRGSGLDALSVKSMQDKQYISEDDMPIWGIETPNMTLSAIEPLWGLIDPASAHLVNITTLQSPHLYIPAGSSAFSRNVLAVASGTNNVPGTSAPAAIWNTAYAPRIVVSDSGLQDLSGLNRMSLASTWKRMSTTPAGTAGIMNLIWTDFAANALVGTKGWVDDRGLPPNLQGEDVLQKRDGPATTRASTPGSASVPVHIFVRQTHYRWLYAIPAAVTLLLAAIICVAALVALASGKGSVARIGYYLNHLSAGRLLVAVQTQVKDFTSKRKVWLEGSGRRNLGLATDGDNGDGDGLLEGDEEDGGAEQHVVQPKRDRSRGTLALRR